MYNFIQAKNDILLKYKTLGELEMPWLSSMDATLAINDEQSNVIAFIRIGMCDEHKYTIVEFEVLKSFRKKGHGMAIITQVLNDYNSIFTLTPFDEFAIIFWSKCGFKLVDSGDGNISMLYDRKLYDGI